MLCFNKHIKMIALVYMELLNMGFAEEIVIKKIRNAFGKDCYNNGELTLTNCIIAHDYGSEESIIESRDKNKRQPWYEIPEDWIEKYHYVFYFIDALGAKYYLPAYMTWVLRNYRTSDSLTADSLIYCLEGYGNINDKNNKWDGLKPKCNVIQKAAVRAFLKHMLHNGNFMIDQDACKSALERWVN